MRVDLKQWHPRRATPYRIWMFIGSTGKGKSHAAKYIASWWKYIDDVHLFSTTEDETNFWTRSSVPKLMYSDTYDDDRMTQLIKRNKEWYSMRNENPELELPALSTLVILEDLGKFKQGKVTKRVTEMGNIQELSTKGRHAGFTMIILNQRAMQGDTESRSGAHFIVISQLSTGDDIDAVYKTWMKPYMHKDNFNQLVEKYTHNYGLLIYEAGNQSSDIFDKLFYFRCPESYPEPRLGSEEFWKFAESRYDNNKKTHPTPEWAMAKPQDTPNTPIPPVKKTLNLRKGLRIR